MTCTGSVLIEIYDVSTSLSEIRQLIHAERRLTIVKVFAKWRRLAAALIGILVATAAYRYWWQRDPRVIPLDPAIYDKYTGYYTADDGSYVSIRREGQSLMAYVPEHAGKVLRPETTSTFFIAGEPGRYHFERDPENRVVSLLAVYPKFQQRVKRISNPESLLTKGRNGMVAASAGGNAVAAGIDILKLGGSAMDAAMATALCEVVQVGGATISYAGVMAVLYFDAGTGTVHYLDGWYNTPAAEENPSSIPDKGGRTAMVPGFMATIESAHKRFGKLPFSRLFDPAIQMAENGITVDKMLAWWIDTKKSTLSRFPATKTIFCRADGGFLKAGDSFQQIELGKTLRAVATQGSQYMYTGNWGQRFVDAVQKAGGSISLQDMRSYRAIEEQPTHTSYGSYEIYGPGFSASGGVQMIEAFNLVQAAELRSYGHYTASPESLVWLMEFTDLERHLGYSERRVLERDLSPQTRVTTESAAWMWNKMRAGEWPWLPKSMQERAVHPNHSSGIVTVDQWGNMAVVAHTINTNLWGDTGLFVDGVSIPDSARHNRAEIQRAGPGHRLPGRMVPLLITRAGKPVLGSSATGVGHVKSMQVLVNILDYGMDPRSAVDMPAFLLCGQVEEGTFAPTLLDHARALGLPVKVLSPKTAASLHGNWVGIQKSTLSSGWQGAATLGPLGQVQGY